MLDENLPTFFFKPSSDNQRNSTVFLGQGGHDLQPEYTLKRPDPSLPASKNCYAVALYDSYNPEVLFAEVLVQPEWTQPTLSAAEIRAQNGVQPSPVPLVPNSFVIQLYNPDQQVIVKHIAGSWNSSAHWEFEMPQQSFRIPSTSALDRSQSDPAASDVTPKITFKWKRDGKLSKDISCYLAGRSTEGKKSKEPDITVAMFQHGKQVTIYEPNMNRVEVEDSKGLEVVLLLSATVIRDIFFNASREMFNIDSPPTSRKNSGGAAIFPGKASNNPPTASGALPAPLPYSNIQPSQIPLPPRPTQEELDAETARLLAIVKAEEKERERAERREEKRIKKMLEDEEKERQRREKEVAKETERLRKQYGVDPVSDNHPRLQFSPPMPPRPLPAGQPPVNYNQSQQFYPPPHQQPFPEYLSAPHSTTPPIQRPQSTPATNSFPARPFGITTPNSWWGGQAASAATPPPPKQSHRHKNSASGSNQQQESGQGTSGFSGLFSSQRERDDRGKWSGTTAPKEGGKKKVEKKRSVYF